MKATIIDVDIPSSDGRIFDTGIKFRGYTLFLESTGDNTRDRYHKKLIRDKFQDYLLRKLGA